MIKFTDFIKEFLEKIDVNKVKFKLNRQDGTDWALDLLTDDDNTKNTAWYTMNAWKNIKHSNLNGYDYLITFAQHYIYGNKFYVFGGIYKVEKIEPEVFDDIGYNLTLLDDYSEYRKRLIIKVEENVGLTFNRTFDSFNDKLSPEIYSLLPDAKLREFTGYQNVCLSHKDLQSIKNASEPSWLNALNNVKAIYVITDLKTGRLYIGSASGNGKEDNNRGLWKRWNNYADINDPTGDNKYFIQIKEKEGEKYIIENFQYSILEIFDTKVKDVDILEREKYWKKVFATKNIENLGMNCN